MSQLIIAIDGPVGSGKSTVARRVADLLGYTYLDSGAMYRAVGWKALRDGVSLDRPEELESLARDTRIDLAPTNGELRVIVDGEDVTARMRSLAVSQAASRVAVVPGVRHVLVDEQRRAGASGGVVMEGRDIGTVVFPHADLKIFLDASVEVRAERRARSICERARCWTSRACSTKCTSATGATANAEPLPWCARTTRCWSITRRWTWKKPRG